MALYLKYRPQTFSDMVGQDFIKSTLKAAVDQDKTVGAYLFTGPRGTGKTSSARIFAKAVNCQKSNVDDFNKKAVDYTIGYLSKKGYNIDYKELVSDIKFSRNISNFSYDTRFILSAIGRYQNSHENTKKHSFIDYYYEKSNQSLNDFLDAGFRIGEINNYVHTGLTRFDIRLFPNFGEQEKPCNLCNSCIGFNQEHLVDIVEIDAASHTGVDNIRDIIEKAQFRPTSAKYKVYIIDEVHMLSKGAFNALLKILEEPPLHVKFILATTEIHKVPETILSRCQRYDFKNFTDKEIIGRLKYIAEQEGISVDDESYNYIAKIAQGGMRNAVSLFEQLIHEKTISYSHITETLGIASEDEKNTLLEKLLAKDTSVLDDIEKLLAEGKNLKNFFLSLTHLLQEKAIGSLKTNTDAQAEILLLDSLHDLLMKLKNSFDEKLTITIGILKILSGVSEKAQVQQVEAKAPIKTIHASSTESKKEVQTPSVKPQVQETNQEDILAQAEDIFGAPQEAAPVVSDSNKVDITTLITEVKKLGGKAALTMSIKGSSFENRDGIMHISTKTKIANNTIAKIENRECILQALENMSYAIDDIKIS